jgi:hypothetical protein
MPGEETIGQWTQTQLIRTLRDYLEQQPPSYLQTLRVDKLQVETLLNLKPASITLLTDASWKVIGAQGAPAFTNSWVAFGGSSGAPGFWKDPFGIVHLKGVTKLGTVGTAAWTMPPGYRPVEKQEFGTISNGAIGYVVVNTDGTVVPTTPSNNTYVALAGLTYRIA